MASQKDSWLVVGESSLIRFLKSNVWRTKMRALSALCLAALSVMSYPRRPTTSLQLLQHLFGKRLTETYRESLQSALEYWGRVTYPFEANDSWPMM